MDEGELTPAQVFYMENRDRLVSRAQDYYLETCLCMEQGSYGCVFLFPQGTPEPGLGLFPLFKGSLGGLPICIYTHPY